MSLLFLAVAAVSGLGTQTPQADYLHELSPAALPALQPGIIHNRALTGEFCGTGG
jgi:hypothetical protein